MDMIQDRLEKIEERLKQSKITDNEKAELLNLMASLKTEIAGISQTHLEQAESIAGFAELSTREATRTEKSQELFDLSVEGLTTSVREFEVSHPDLVEVINRFCTMLANLGI
jgi:hypothetical protein